MKSEQSVITLPKKHSILGIASLFFTLLYCLPIVIIFAIAPEYFTGYPTEITHKLVYWGTGICMVALNPISFVLGLIALFQKNTKKLFAILGITFSMFQMCLATVVLLFIFYLNSM